MPPVRQRIRAAGPPAAFGTNFQRIALYFVRSQSSAMSIRYFIKKQFIDVIQWTEPEDGILAYRYPMEDMEIQNGGKLTVRDSQMAVFVNEGRLADVFGPGLYTLTTQTPPILTYIMNWDKAFKSPF